MPDGSVRGACMPAVRAVSTGNERDPDTLVSDAEGTGTPNPAPDAPTRRLAHREGCACGCGEGYGL